MPAGHSEATRALRACAWVWIVATIADPGFGFAYVQFKRASSAGDVATSYVGDLLDVFPVVSFTTHTIASVALFAIAWAWVRPATRRARLAKVGWVLFGLHLAAFGAVRLFRFDDTGVELEHLQLLQLAETALLYGGMVLLLAGTRAPVRRSLAFAIAAGAVMSFDLWAGAQEVQIDGPWWSWWALHMAMDLGWALALWTAAAHHEDEAAEARGPRATDADDRLTAADGIRLVRAGLIARLVTTVGGAWLLEAAWNSGAATGLAWLVALAGIGATAAIAIGLTRYRALPGHALHRGLVSMVIVGLAMNAVLDLWGAYATARLLELSASSSEPALVRAHAEWGGRIAVAIGLGVALALLVSLRITAAWLHDRRATRLAHALALVMLLGGGLLVLRDALPRPEANRSFEAILAIAMMALAIGLWLVITWYRLLGAIRHALLTAPAEQPDEHEAAVTAAR